MAPPLLTLQHIALTFGGTPLLSAADLTVEAGDRMCLVGRNGSGKSTLLKIAAGLIEPDRGERIVKSGVTIRYLPQEPDLTGHSNVLAFVEAGLTSGDDPYRAQYLLAQLGLTGQEYPVRLSGGEARRAALARALAPEPDILLLDEPTNHLDLPAIEWLEAELGSLKSAIVTISHDRRFLEKLSRKTLWIDRGATKLLNQGFTAFEAWRDEVLEQEERDAHKLDRKIVMEEHWLRYGVTARRKRNQGRMRALSDLRQKRREARRGVETLNAQINQGELSGKLVMEAKCISKSYAGRPIVANFSCRIQRGDRIGIVGPNGAGKTTLINLLSGTLVPDTGELKLGANLKMVTLDQRREALDPATSLRDTLTDGRGDQVRIGDTTKHFVSYMKDFLFSPEQAGTAVAALSGGERGRLMLARAFAKPSNLLVLDEPTNDLDLETLDLLQELLASYAGTVLLVSHDRDFLDRVVTSVIAAEGKGVWREYAGGYSDMLAQRGSDLTRAAAPAKAKADKQARQPEAPRAKAGLSFTQLHALKTLPARMEKLHTEINTLQEMLAAPGLFAKDQKGFTDLAAKLDKAQQALAQAEEEWLELEMLREESGV